MGRPSSVIHRMMPGVALFIEQGHRLPATAENKVNVEQLCKELKKIGGDVNPSDVQHFFKKEDLKNAVNALAAKQGLLPIGNRAPADDTEILEQRLQQARKEARQDALAAIEASAALNALLEELKLVHAELEEKKLENNSLKERLRLIEENGFLISLPIPNWRA